MFALALFQVKVEFVMMEALIAGPMARMVKLLSNSKTSLPIDGIVIAGDALKIVVPDLMRIVIVSLL